MPVCVFVVIVSRLRNLSCVKIMISISPYSHRHVWNTEITFSSPKTVESLRMYYSTYLPLTHLFNITLVPIFFPLFIPKLIPKKSNKNLYRLQYIYLLLYVFYHGVDGNWQFFAQLEIIPSREPILIRHQSTQAYIYTQTQTIYFAFQSIHGPMENHAMDRKREKKKCF